MMRTVVASGLVALLAAACGGNPVAPMAPPSLTPETPAARPLFAAPKAVLSIGRGDVTLPVAIVSFTELVFDGSHSEGEGLTYLLEFGDGASSTDPATTHRPNPGGSSLRPDKLLAARLTVTDRHGRSDSTEQPYLLASVGSPDANAWWSNSPGRGSVWRRLVLTQDGATLSGYYTGPDSNKARRVTGALSDDRTLRLRTEDGAIEFTGSVEWKGEDLGGQLVLRLTMRGAGVQGVVLDFDFADPY